jgi:hypothetical protein
MILEKYNMPCHAMLPIQDLFFSYMLQIDMHLLCAPMLTKFYSYKKWVLQAAFVLGNIEVAASGGRAAPTKATIKGARKGATGGKKGEKR